MRVPYSQRYLFNAIPNTNHSANPTNPTRNSKGNPNPTNPTNANTRYRCEYGARFSRIAFKGIHCTAVYTASNDWGFFCLDKDA